VRLPRRGDPPLLLDGGMGTALIARGLPPDRVPEAWVLERPAEVAAVHAAHVAAGARAVLTCTFNLARLDLAGQELEVTTVAARAVALARAPRPGAVLGAVGPTGLRPGNGASPSVAELRERYDAPFRALAAAGADLLWAETQLDLVEARAALLAARRTGLPAIVTVHVRERPGGLAGLDGTPAPDLLEALWRDGASAVGVNCVQPDPGLARAVAAVAVRVPVPLVVKPNAGLPGEPVEPEPFAVAVAVAVRAGATLAGGCCGAGPRHLAALRARLDAQARG
jgi:5-methyltetrahydrofolate--homocysteine methyltransferase